MVAIAALTGVVGTLAVVGVVLRVLGSIQANRAEFGGPRERNLERRSGLAPIGRQLAGNLARARQLYQRVKANVLRERARQAQAKGERRQAAKAAAGLAESPQGALDAAVIQEDADAAAAEAAAAIEDSKAAEDTVRSAESLLAIQGRAVGLIEGLSAVQQAIEAYVQRATAENTKEAQEAQALENLAGKLGSQLNYQAIDAQAAASLQAYFANILAYLRAEAATESSKEGAMLELLQRLTEASKEMKEVSGEAKAAGGLFAKFVRKADKDCTKEIKAFMRAVAQKAEELRNAKRAGKDADAALIGRVARELALMKWQAEAAKRLDGQIQSALKMMDAQAKQGNAIRKSLAGDGKALAAFDQELESIDKRIAAKFKGLRQALAELEKTPATLTSGQSVLVPAIAISGGLNRYLRQTRDVAMMTGGFDKCLRKSAATGFEMAKLTVSYEQLLASLTQSEEAAAKGTQLVINILQSVSSDAQMTAAERDVAATLEALKGALSDEEKIERYLESVVKTLESKLAALVGAIDTLAGEDGRIAASLERSSTALGTMMAGVVDRKIAIDERYLAPALQFGNDLAARNAAAAKAFSRAIKTKLRV